MRAQQFIAAAPHLLVSYLMNSEQKTQKSEYSMENPNVLVRDLARFYGGILDEFNKKTH